MSGISTGTAMLLSAGTSAVGSAASGFGQYEAGQQKRTAYDLNADQTSAEIEQKTANLVGKQAVHTLVLVWIFHPVHRF